MQRKRQRKRIQAGYMSHLQVADGWIDVTQLKIFPFPSAKKYNLWEPPRQLERYRSCRRRQKISSESKKEAPLHHRLFISYDSRYIYLHPTWRLSSPANETTTDDQTWRWWPVTFGLLRLPPLMHALKVRLHTLWWERRGFHFCATVVFTSELRCIVSCHWSSTEQKQIAINNSRKAILFDYLFNMWCNEYKCKPSTPIYIINPKMKVPRYEINV